MSSECRLFSFSFFLSFRLFLFLLLLLLLLLLLPLWLTGYFSNLSHQIEEILRGRRLLQGARGVLST
jgi:hypothetical protein